jgi:creatinine amidohydrolase
MTAPIASLCVADDATFWPWFSWPEFAAWPDKDRTVVVLPLAGFSDWGLDCPLDAEETALLHVLREASRRRPADLGLLVLPPLRFVLGPDPGAAFAVDPDVACALIEEVAASVAAAGFRRIVFFNSSPWNEELIRATGRDLRIGRGLQVFCVNLSALGLDFHPVRGGDRAGLRRLLASIAAGAALGDGGAADRLVSLLCEIRSRPPLADGGVLRSVSPP